MITKEMILEAAKLMETSDDDVLQFNIKYRKAKKETLELAKKFGFSDVFVTTPHINIKDARRFAYLSKEFGIDVKPHDTKPFIPYYITYKQDGKTIEDRWDLGNTDSIQKAFDKIKHRLNQ